MDGVLRIGPKPIPGVNEFLERIKEKHVMIITNECRGGPNCIRKDLLSIGIDIRKKWLIYTASMCCYYYLKDGKKWSIIGDNKLYDFLIEKLGNKNYSQYTGDYLVIGAMYIDIWNKQKDKLKKILNLNKNIKIIMTCPDKSDPYAKTISPYNIVSEFDLWNNICYIGGKPNSKYILKHLKNGVGNISSKDLLFIGDNTETDMVFAEKNGIDSILVLSGVTKEPDNRFTVYKSVADIL